MRYKIALTALVAFVGLDAQSIGQDAKGDLAKLQGDWSIIALQRRGKEEPKEKIEKSVVTFKGTKLTMRHKDDPRVREFTIKLDPTKKPAAIDLMPLTNIDVRDKIIPGIYSFDGKSLVLCIPNGKVGDRPTEFKSGGDSDLIVMTLVPAK